MLPAGRYLARSYGSTRTVAVDLTDIASFNRDDTHLQQQHFDKLGVWNADPTEAFAGRTLVSDVATMGVAFMTTALDYVDKFSELVLCNKPRAVHNAHPVMDRFQGDLTNSCPHLVPRSSSTVPSSVGIAPDNRLCRPGCFNQPQQLTRLMRCPRSLLIVRGSSDAVLCVLQRCPPRAP